MNPKEIVNSVLKENKEKNIFTVFDFDNTCIINDIGEAVFSYMCENSLLKKRDSKKTFQTYHKLLETGNIKKTKQAYILLPKIFEGFSEEEIKNIARKVIKFEGKKLKKRKLFETEITKGLKSNKKTKKLISLLNKNNISVWIVSASPKVCVEVAFQYFFPKNKVKIIGFENKTKNGVFTPKLISPLPMFEGKVQCIKKYINKSIEPVLAVGDSENDQKMLEYSKIRIVVNRNNSLSQLAKEKGWMNLTC